MKVYGFYCEKCARIVSGLFQRTFCCECGGLILCREVTGLNEKEIEKRLTDNHYHVPCQGQCGYIINQTPPLSEKDDPYRDECYNLCCDCCVSFHGYCLISDRNILAAVA